MNMKDTLILLMFLLCILGLIMGVYYSESVEPTLKTDNSKEAVHQDSNKTTTPSVNENDIHIEDFIKHLIPLGNNF